MNIQNKLINISNILFSIIFTLMLSSLNAATANEPNIKVKMLRVNNYDMAYVEKGHGEPLILVHGAISDYRTWLPLIDEFSEENHTIAVSLRHYYPEKWDGKGNNLSLQQHADDLGVFIKTLNLGPVHLLGHSRGGAVALLTASKYPNLVSKLILADPSPLNSMLEKKPVIQGIINKRKTVLHKVMKYYNDGNTEAGIKTYVNYVAGKGAWGKTSIHRRNTVRENAWTTISLLHDSDTPFNCTNTSKLSAQVLLITGERSKPLYEYMNSALRKCLKNPTDIIISDAGHMMFSANPTAFIFEVQDFILSKE